MAKKIAENQTSSRKDVKLRHSTGAYLHMHDAPTEEDMTFFLSTQKLKAADIASMIKAFGEHKADKIEATIRTLNTKLIVRRGGENSDVISLQ